MQGTLRNLTLSLIIVLFSTSIKPASCLRRPIFTYRSCYYILRSQRLNIVYSYIKTNNVLIISNVSYNNTYTVG
ncbi:hypothetical protein OTSTA763_1720 [Orientia tsutsugamushi str. TA763]|nr:hypothetical protein OTSTA763_1720 [Orientia tsutsugamushi str. TA763]